MSWLTPLVPLVLIFCRRIQDSLKSRHVVQCIDKIIDMKRSKLYIIMEVSSEVCKGYGWAPR